MEVVEQLDLSAIEQAYRGRGSPAYPPKLMVALLFYGYATGVFSSRKLEQASYESVPFIYMAGGLHPDHNSINSFRKWFLAQLEELFVQILLIACHLGVLKLGDIFIDGSKVEAKASKHKALRVGTMPTSWKRGLKPRWRSGWSWPRPPMATNTEG
jgi:transposase